MIAKNNIIDAKQLKADLIHAIGDKFKNDFHDKGKITSVMIINASDDEANKRYIKQKKNMLDSIGVRCFIKEFDSSCTNSEIYRYIDQHQNEFDGVMIQSPVYNHIAYEYILSAINYKKDIDGLHPMNQGLLYSKDNDALLPCTALGVLNIFRQHYMTYWNKNVVIVGRGKLVADPLAKLLEYQDCTVTKVHTKTDIKTFKDLISKAEIIISCAGKDLTHMINPDTVSDDLEALIGVGFRYENGKQVQDFDCKAPWKYEVQVTSDTYATGTATVCALVENLLRIIDRGKTHV